MLSGLRGYAQDPRYRMIVTDLLARHLERAEAALDNNDPQDAQRWLDTAKEEPFRILGRRTDIARLEEEVRQMRRRRYGVWAISGVVIIIILGAVAFATESTWQPILNPPTDTPTLTPSITPTNTASVTPTITPTDTLTPTPSYTPSQSPTPTWTYTPSFTPSHTWTPTPTDTPTHTYTPSITPTPSDTPEPTDTPTLTPTPSVLCYVYADREAVNVRAQPNPAGILIYTINLGQSMEVIWQQIGTDNQRWFQVRLEVEDALITGWVRADLVKQLGSNRCPTLGQ
jgi:hypothetical protein